MWRGYDTITVVQCTVRHDTMRCSETTLRYDIMMVRYDMVRLSYEYDTIQYDTIQCDANDTIWLLYCKMPYDTMQHDQDAIRYDDSKIRNTWLSYDTMQYETIWYDAALLPRAGLPLPHLPVVHDAMPSSMCASKSPCAHSRRLFWWRGPSSAELLNSSHGALFGSTRNKGNRLKSGLRLVWNFHDTFFYILGTRIYF